MNGTSMYQHRNTSICLPLMELPLSSLCGVVVLWLRQPHHEWFLNQTGQSLVLAFLGNFASLVVGASSFRQPWAYCAYAPLGVG